MDLDYDKIKEYHALHTYIEEHYQAGKTNYLLWMKSTYFLLVLGSIVNTIKKFLIKTSFLMITL